METDSLPPILYRYLGFGPWIESVINGSAIRFRSPLKLNDPFEARPSYLWDVNDPETLRYQHRVAKKYGLGIHARMRKIAELNRRLKRQAGRNVSSDSTRDMLGRYGVLCLTPHKDNLLMWSHYGAGHRGLCIGFDTSQHFFQAAWPVKYQERYPEINPATVAKWDGVEKSILTKAKCWQYENEWRAIKLPLEENERKRWRREYAARGASDLELDVLTDHRGPNDYSFPSSLVREVVLGAEIDPDDARQITLWRDQWNPSAKILKAKCHQNEYRLEFSEP